MRLPRILGGRKPSFPSPTRDEVQADLEELSRIAQKAADAVATAERLVVAAEARERDCLEMLEHHRSSLERIRAVHKQAQIAETATATRLRDRVAEARR